MSSRFWQ